jgi:hypothetical protein
MDGLTAITIGRADDRRLAYVRVCVENIFDFAGPDFEPGGNDYVFLRSIRKNQPCAFITAVSPVCIQSP